MKEPICFAAAVTVLLATSALHADVVVLQPDAADLQDTWIWNGDDFPHGGDRELRANQTTSFDQRILIQFLDLSAIPDNAIINSAMLELFRYDAFTNNPLTLSAYRVLEPWPEDVTFSGQPSHDAVAEDAIVVTVDGWYSWDLTSLVQAYVDDSATNHGVTIYDSGTGFFQRFASSDVDGPGVGPLHPGPDFRPKLTVDFTPGTPSADRSLIIKQGACPAPVNPGSNGVTPMLLVGEPDFDVNIVVLASLELARCDGVGGAIGPLNGPPGPGSQIVDLNHPNDDDVGCVFGQVPCACHADESSDGIDDLKLKFRTSDMTDAFMLDGEPSGSTITLFLTGELADGSTFAAADCIRLVGQPAPLGILAVESNLTDVWIEATPLDGILDGGGFTPFTRSWPGTTFVTLSAPATLPQGWTFAGWSGDFTPIGPTDKPQVDVMLWAPASIEAIYIDMADCPTDINGDGATNVLDLVDLLLCFGQAAVPGCVAEDVNNDGSVNVLDLIDLLLAFGTACP